LKSLRSIFANSKAIGLRVEVVEQTEENYS